MLDLRKCERSILLEQVYYRYILRQVDIQDYLLTSDCAPFVQLQNLTLRTKHIFSLIVMCTCITT